MSEIHPDQTFVELVVKSIVKHPDDVKVGRIIDERGVLVTLELNKEDMGTVIGKNGQTAKALRVLLRVIGSKNNARVNLKIVDPTRDENAPQEQNVNTHTDVLDSLGQTDF